MDGSVDAAIKRHVANATFCPPPTTNNNLPPELQQLPLGYSIQEIPSANFPFDENTPPATANRVTTAPPDQMQTMMKNFFAKMDKSLKAQESALRNITNSNGGGGGGGYDGGG